MMGRLQLAVATILTVISPALSGPAPPRIVAGPEVTKTAGGYTVSFELDKPCDVTVRIVNARGEVERHLVCGVVGLPKAVEPLVPNSLSQNIPWDGHGDPGGGGVGPCKVVVNAGMQAKFDKFIIWEKNACPRSRQNNYYTAPDGRCYVNQSSGVHLDTLRLFDNRGRFVRQVWPPSFDRSGEALQKLLSGDWGATDWDGDGVPLKVCYNSWYIFGVRSGPVAFTSDERLIGVFRGVGQGFYGLDPNGFPSIMHWKPPWFTRSQMYKTRWGLGVGTNGDVYITDNFHHLVGHFRAVDMSPVNSFTYCGEEELEAPRYTLGEKGKSGDDPVHFLGPDDVALDRAGNLCVLDGQKVRVYTPTGRFLKETSRDAFPAKEPVPPEVSAAQNHPRALCFPQFMSLDGRGRLIIMNHGAGKPILESDVEGRTVKALPLPWGYTPYHGYSDFDATGNLYLVASARNQPQQIWKIAPDGTRAKFGDKNAILLGWEGDRFAYNKGLCVAENGDLYVVVTTDKWSTKFPDQTGGVKFGDLSARGEEVCQTRVDVYGPDGSLKRKGIVKSTGINDVAVDRAGNIYVIEGTMWHGAQMGAVASGRSVYGKQHWPFSYLTPGQARLDPHTDSNKRYSLLSRLVKFGPRGGILDHSGAQAQLWQYAGVSGVSPWHCGNECPAAQICLDPDERIWVADSFMYCVKAIDGAGNEMLRVGKYGNEDCTGGGGDAPHPELRSVVINPEIPLAYPKGMAVHKDWLFISDMFTHRVLRCRLDYSHSKEAALP